MKNFFKVMIYTNSCLEIILAYILSSFCLVGNGICIFIFYLFVVNRNEAYLMKKTPSSLIQNRIKDSKLYQFKLLFSKLIWLVGWCLISYQVLWVICCQILFLYTRRKRIV